MEVTIDSSHDKPLDLNKIRGELATASRVQLARMARKAETLATLIDMEYRSRY